MEILYHGSPVAGLTVLEPHTPQYFGKPRQVCLTSSEAMALLYGVRHFEYTYGYTQDGQLYFEEYFPNALEEIYSGKRAYLYRCARRDDMAPTAIPNEFVSDSPVPVLEGTAVPDVYEALLEKERTGALRIVRWALRTEASRQWTIQEEKDSILEHGLLHRDDAFARYMRGKYPESWDMARRQEKERER